jgi:predicted RNase H-like HicB family nuclease
LTDGGPAATFLGMQVEVEREDDGRWIAEVPALPGAMAYGATKEEAVAKVESLVLRVLADKIEHGEDAPEVRRVFTVAA